MKKRILALITAALMAACTGCSQLLERSYSSAEKHYEQYVELDESSAIEVSDARSLESAIVYFVRQGTDMGTVRARDYEGSITDDLTRICLSLQDDALGAYGIEYISHEKLSMVSYSEINIYFTYKKTPEQISALRDVSYYNLEQAFRDAFSGGDEYAAFNISYLPMSDDEVRRLAQEASELAGITESVAYEVTLYPESGLHRIVELTADYGMTPDLAYSMRIRLNKEADAVLDGIREAREDMTAENIASALRERCAYSTQGSCAYDSVVNGLADDLGFARGVLYLCDRADVDCAIKLDEYSGSYIWYDPAAESPPAP